MFWRSLYPWLLHPVDRYRWHRKGRRVPRAGDFVQDCRGQVHQVVTADGDDLVLDDGYRCSWMHCCGPP